MKETTIKIDKSKLNPIELRWLEFLKKKRKHNLPLTTEEKKVL